MIKATELRIGNLIKSVYNAPFLGNPIVVDGMFIKQCDDIERRNKKVEGHEPIPITKEWLLKFGFIEGDELGEFYNSEGIFGVALNHQSDQITSVVPLHIWDASFTGANCQYLHQLQNLFFALTGEELEIK